MKLKRMASRQDVEESFRSTGVLMMMKSLMSRGCDVSGMRLSMNGSDELPTLVPDDGGFGTAMNSRQLSYMRRHGMLRNDRTTTEFAEFMEELMTVERLREL